MPVTLKSIFDAPHKRAQLAEGIWFADNWHWTSQPVWSRDKTCLLMFDPAQSNEPDMLVFELSVFNATPENPKTMCVESDGHAPLEVEVTNNALHSILLQRPIAKLDTAMATMAFTLNEIDSPAKQGLSADDRFLGLTISRVTPCSKELTLPLDFSSETVCAAYLREGWEQPEPGGIWSNGPKARIVLPAYLQEGQQQSLSFDFEVLPRPEGVEPLHVTVEAEGQTLDSWVCTTDQTGPYVCHLPSSKANGGDLEIILHIHNPLSPKDLTVNKDPRPLGIRLREISGE